MSHFHFTHSHHDDDHHDDHHDHHRRRRHHDDDHHHHHNSDCHHHCEAPQNNYVNMNAPQYPYYGPAVRTQKTIVDTSLLIEGDK